MEVSPGWMLNPGTAGSILDPVSTRKCRDEAYSHMSLINMGSSIKFCRYDGIAVSKRMS
jgi:hypothetical protein